MSFIFIYYNIKINNLKKMSEKTICKVDSDCTMGKAGGCCAYAQIVNLGTLTPQEKSLFNSSFGISGLKK
jgi:hypothetical protein